MQKNLITQGIPSLLPDKRDRLDTTVRTRALDRANLFDAISKDEASVAHDGEVDATDGMRQIGYPLSTQQLIDRLRKMNPNLIFEVSKSDSTKQGIYIPAWQRDPLTGGYRFQKQFICGMENGFMPEFSVLHAEDKRVPDPDFRGNWKTIQTFVRETRGWRTVLARLLRMRLITEPQINRYFDFSRDSQRWQLLTN